jgi:hypothetical protein
MNTSRPYGLTFVLTLLILVSSVPAAQRPNILWIVAEDMSPTLGCYGDAFAITQVDQNLYNLEDDPHEFKDLSRDPKHQALLKNFKQQMFDGWKTTGGAPIAHTTSSAESPTPKTQTDCQTSERLNAGAPQSDRRRNDE